MSLLIEKEGILTTVQDLGRTGYRDLGINPGGAMDRTAVSLINILLGNDESDAVLEFHFSAVILVFEQPAVFALGGADFDVRLNSKRIENWRPHFADAGSKLFFVGKPSGDRLYLAVRGGFSIDKWLGSCSTNLVAQAGGFNGRRLRVGDRIKFRERIFAEQKFNYFISPSLIPFYSPFPTVRIIAGAEFDLLNKNNRKSFLESTYTISNRSDRMGYRLTGEHLKLTKNVEMLSSAVSFGTIQLLPDGNLIVLMADHQTTGGYPRLGHVISLDLPLLAQLGPSDKVGFHLNSIEEAENLSLQFEQELNLFRIGCRLRSTASS